MHFSQDWVQFSIEQVWIRGVSPFSFSIYFRSLSLEKKEILIFQFEFEYNWTLDM